MRFSVQACGDGFAFSVLVMIKRQVLSALLWLSRDSSVKRSFIFYAAIFKGEKEDAGGNSRYKGLILTTKSCGFLEFWESSVFSNVVV
jgi:hypothetical protein